MDLAPYAGVLALQFVAPATAALGHLAGRLALGSAQTHSLESAIRATADSVARRHPAIAAISAEIDLLGDELVAEELVARACGAAASDWPAAQERWRALYGLQDEDLVEPFLEDFCQTLAMTMAERPQLQGLVAARGILSANAGIGRIELTLERALDAITLAGRELEELTLGPLDAVRTRQIQSEARSYQRKIFSSLLEIGRSERSNEYLLLELLSLQRAMALSIHELDSHVANLVAIDPQGEEGQRTRTVRGSNPQLSQGLNQELGRRAESLERVQEELAEVRRIVGLQRTSALQQLTALQDLVSASRDDEARSSDSVSAFLRFFVDEQGRDKSIREWYIGTACTWTRNSLDPVVTAGESAESAVEGWLDGTEPFLVVLGDYGTGKTTLAKRVAAKAAASRLAGNGHVLPFLVQLRRYARAMSTGSLVRDYLADIGVDIRELRRLPPEDKILVMLDGLDEVSPSLAHCLWACPDSPDRFAKPLGVA
jgi:hypothetical protein